MNECSCFSQSLLLPVTQLLPRFGALSMELREGKLCLAMQGAPPTLACMLQLGGLDRVLGELLQTQELLLGTLSSAAIVEMKMPSLVLVEAALSPGIALQRPSSSRCGKQSSSIGRHCCALSAGR